MTNRYFVDEHDRYMVVVDTNNNAIIKQWDKQRISSKCPCCGNELWQWDAGVRERAEAKKFTEDLNSREQIYISTTF